MCKVIAPFLEDCSLEEDEGLREKWAALLVNTVIESSSIENGLFSHILSQLSPNDAKVLDLAFKTVQHSSNGDSKMWAHTGSSIDMSGLQSSARNLTITIDNLIRLRLLKEAHSGNPFSVVLTSLGVLFLINCNYPG